MNIPGSARVEVVGESDSALGVATPALPPVMTGCCYPYPRRVFMLWALIAENRRDWPGSAAPPGALSCS